MASLGIIPLLQLEAATRPKAKFGAQTAFRHHGGNGGNHLEGFSGRYGPASVRSAILQEALQSARSLPQENRTWM
jgi:hypothetical protein